MKIVLFFILLSSTLCLGNDNKYIMVRHLKGQAQLEKDLSSSLNRTVLKFLASLPEYQLMMNPTSPPEKTTLNIFAVDGEITKEGKDFNFTLSLLDLKKQVVLRSVSHSKIREEDFIRIIKAGLEALFEAVPVEENQKSLQKSKQETDKEKAESSAKNPNNEKVIDFKERIKGLQSQADSAIVKKNKEGDKNSDEVAKSNQSSASNSGLFSNNSEEEVQANLPFFEKFRKIFRSHSVEALLDRRFIKTDSYIQTTSEMSLVQLKLFGHLWTNPSQEWAINYGIGNAIPVASEVPAPSLTTAQISGGYEKPNFTASLGLRREDYVFFNIPDPGGGLQGASIQANQAFIALSVTPNKFDRKWTMGASYSSLLSGQSGWLSLKNAKNFKGQSYSLELIPPYVVYGCKFRIMVSNMTTNAQGAVPFKLNETRFVTGATFTF
jgi:hypothetical protein